MEVTLDNSQNRIPFRASELTVRKAYNCHTDREEYHINGQSISQKDLFNLFESGNFSLSSSAQFQVVAQGKVQELVDKGETGFLEMLKEVTGTAQFDQKIDGMAGSIRDAQGKKQQLEQVLVQIKGKLDKLEAEIEVFNGYDAVEKDKKALERCLYAQKMQLNLREIEEQRGVKRGLMAERERLLVQREEFLKEQNLAEAEGSKAGRIREEIGKLERQVLGLQQVRQEIMNKQMAELEGFGNLGGQQSTTLLGPGQQRSLLDYFGAGGMGAEGLQQQLAEVSANIDTMRKDAAALEKKKTELSEGLQKVQSKLGELQKEKDALLLQREAAQNMSTPAQVAKFYREEQSRLQVQGAQASQDLVDSERERTNLSKQLVELEERLGGTSSELGKNQACSREALVQIEQARKLKLTIAGQVKNLIFVQSELDHEMRVKQQRIASFAKQIEKVEPIFGALQRIDHKCKEMGLAGYRGLLIDFLQCSSDNFMSCVDIAAKSKLFSIVVDSLETAKQVLEINKQIKGGVINIYPLETMELMRRPAKAVPASAKSLLDIVSLTPSADPRLQCLLESIFGKVVLVRQYEEAMQVAKDHDLTCITADLEVVYAGAFISKVGHYNRAQMDRFSVYQQLFRLKGEVDAMRQRVQAVQADRDKNDLSDLEAFRDLQRAEVTLSQLRQAAHKLSASELELRSQISHKRANLREIEK